MTRPDLTRKRRHGRTLFTAPAFAIGWLLECGAARTVSSPTPRSPAGWRKPAPLRRTGFRPICSAVPNSASESRPRPEKTRLRSEARKKSDAPKAPPGRPARKASPRARTPQSMAARQREISVSEFFTKNRHLLGFDNPQKALLTAVKEAVDNSLDACEEAGILPDLRDRDQRGRREPLPRRRRGQRPRHRAAADPQDLRQAALRLEVPPAQAERGQQGIGISAAGMYGQLTTGKPVQIISRTGKRKPAHLFQLAIDTKKNAPVIQKDAEIEWDAAARHAGRDRAGGGLQEGPALGGRLPRADRARQPARADPLRPPEGRAADLRAGRPTSCPRRPGRSSPTPTASSWACCCA